VATPRKKNYTHTYISRVRRSSIATPPTSPLSCCQIETILTTTSFFLSLDEPTDQIDFQSFASYPSSPPKKNYRKLKSYYRSFDIFCKRLGHYPDTTTTYIDTLCHLVQIAFVFYPFYFRLFCESRVLRGLMVGIEKADRCLFAYHYRPPLPRIDQIFLFQPTHPPSPPPRASHQNRLPPPPRITDPNQPPQLPYPQHALHIRPLHPFRR